MKNLTFKYIAAENFLCYGPEGIQLDLTKLGNIILVKGKNWHDVHSVTGNPGSNGVGKSSIASTFVYGLFGKTPNGDISKANVIHKGSKKLRVEVQWDCYRVIRTHKSLQLWESNDGIWSDETEITAGSGMPETQKKIEAILGMNYRTFVSIFLFDDRNDHCFLECDGPTKRIIVENSLSLDKYREYGKIAKLAFSEANKIVKSMATEYDKLLLDNSIYKNKIQKIIEQQKIWKTNQKTQIEQMEARILDLTYKIQKTDNGSALNAFNSSRERIVILNAEISEITDKQQKIAVMITDTKSKYDSSRQDLHKGELEKNRLLSLIHEKEFVNKSKSQEIKLLESLEAGVQCGKCLGTIDPANALPTITALKQEIVNNQDDLDQYDRYLAAQNQVVGDLRSTIVSLERMVKAATNKNSDITTRIQKGRQEIAALEKIEKPEINKDLAVLQQRICDLNLQMEAKQKEMAGPSPYDEILRESIEESVCKGKLCEEKKKEIEDAERFLPYFKFWVNAFGDDGIRKFIIDGIIPALNAQVAYWLDVLIGGNLKLSFDNMLEETIERVPFNDDSFVYAAMSGGERRRMNLAVIQGFTHIQMLNCGSCPSVLFLDEVATNIDANGKEFIYDMICQLSTSRQIFLTTHDDGLLDLLQGCQTIELERRDGETKLLNLAV